MAVTANDIAKLIKKEDRYVIRVVNREGYSDHVMIVNNRAHDGGLVANDFDLVFNWYSERRVLLVGTLMVEGEPLVEIVLLNHTANDEMAPDDAEAHDGQS